jgi:uncharacterized protein
MKFKIFGHVNILATHPTTLEFTKDKDLTKSGDCIVGVNSDFKITKDVLSAKRIRITISSGGVSDIINAEVNPAFNDSHEIVIRKTGFISNRTLGINASKSSIDIDRRIISNLTNPNSFAEVKIEVIE